MANPSSLLLAFNKERDDFRSAATAAKGTTIPAVLQLCDRLKDILVQSELENAILRGKLQAYYEGAHPRNLHQRPPGPATEERAAPVQSRSEVRSTTQTTNTTAPAPSQASTRRTQPRKLVQLDRPARDKEQQAPPAARSYADAARTAPTNAHRTSKTPSKSKEQATGDKLPASSGTVIVQAKGTTGQGLRQLLASKIDPKSIGVTVKNIYSGPKQVVIKVGSKQQAQQLITTINDQQLPEVSVKESLGKLKSFVLFGVPIKRTTEEAISALASSIGCQESSIKLRTTLAPSNTDSPNKSLVFEAPISTTNKLLKTKRVCMGLDLCVIKPYLSVQRCYRCQRFGHFQRTCKLEPRCVECSEPHDQLPCLAAKNCINCTRANKVLAKGWNTEHSARSSECPAYREALACKKSGQPWTALDAADDPTDEASPAATVEETLPPTQQVTVPTTPPTTSATTSYEEEEEVDMGSPQPPHLKARRTRILRSPDDDRSLSPVRPQTDKGATERRYLTRGRSQDRQEPTSVKVPSKIPQPIRED